MDRDPRALSWAGWAEAWIPGLYIDEAATLVRPNKDQGLRNRLKAAGFPVQGSKDIWHVRTAHVATGRGRHDRAVIVTEDVDFMNPAKKKGSSLHRANVLKQCRGPVVKVLKKANIAVASLYRCPENQGVSGGP